METWRKTVNRQMFQGKSDRTDSQSRVNFVFFRHARVNLKTPVTYNKANI